MHFNSCELKGHFWPFFNSFIKMNRVWPDLSNPIHSPRFRTSASVLTQKATFVFGIPLNIYEFYLSTQNSTFLYQTQVLWFQCRDSFLKRQLQHTKKNSLRTLYAQSFRITLAPSVFIFVSQLFSIGSDYTFISQTELRFSIFIIKDPFFQVTKKERFFLIIIFLLKL